MALATDHVADFGDGTYRFALPIKQLEELDEKTQAGPLTVLKRLLDGSWRLPDVVDTIRLGLVGGGLESAKALTLVRRYVVGEPLERSVPLAVEILAAALKGPRTGGDEGNGKAATSASDPVAGSTSPLSGAVPS